MSCSLTQHVPFTEQVRWVRAITVTTDPNPGLEDRGQENGSVVLWSLLDMFLREF